MDFLNSYPADGIPCPTCQLLCKSSSCHVIENDDEDFTRYSCARCRTELCKIKTILQVPVGICSSNFKDFQTNKLPYVDKTLLIKEIYENEAEAFVIIRPPVFGKSLNLSMISHFFSVLERNSFEKLFEGTKIFQEKGIVKEHASKYAVIHLNFGAFSAAYCHSEKKILEFLKYKLKQIQRRSSLSLRNLNDSDRKALEELDNIEDPAAIIQGLRTLSEVLHRVSGQKCILLIDDFDTLIKRTIDNKKDFEVLKAYYFPFLMNALKENQSLFRGIITSCTTTFGLLGDIPNYSFLEENFQAGFGYTEEEVRELVQKWRRIRDDKIDQELRNLRDYYGGYQVPYKGQILGLYHPISVMKYLGEGEIEPYWEPTSETYFLRDLHKNSPKKALEMAEVLSHDVFEQKIERDLTRVDLHKNNEKLWTLLFFAGYVTQVFDGIAPQKEGYLRLTVPNKERWRAIRSMSGRLELIFDERFQEGIREALQKFDVKGLFSGINNWIREPIPDDPELVYPDGIAYRDIVKGLLKILRGQDWDIIEEKNEIRKRSDIILVPKRATEIKRAYIFEFEFLAKEKRMEKNLREKQREAYKQVLEKKYWKVILEEEYDIEEILGVGVVGCDLWLTFYRDWIPKYEK